MSSSIVSPSGTASDSGAPTWLVWLALGIVYVVWGSTYLAIRVTVETLPPLLTGGVRFIAAGLIVFAWLRLRRGPRSFRLTRAEVGASAVVGAALLFGGNGMVMIAEQDVPSALAALIIASVPLWVVVLRSIFRDKVSLGTLVSVLVGFVGVGVLMLPGSRPEGVRLGGLLLLVAASLSWAGGSFFSKKLPLNRDPLVSTGLQMLLGGLIMAVAGVARGEAVNIDVASFSTASIVALVYLVSIGSLVAFTAYVWLLQNAPISKVATYAYVNPVIAILLGWLILDEKFTTTITLGATIIVASVAFIVRKESAPVPAAERDPAGASDAPPDRLAVGAHSET